MGSLGTGNLLRHDNRLFIATCLHVAEKYFRLKRPYVILRGNTRIHTEELELVSRTNDQIDMALIRIAGAYSSVAAYEPDDFEIIQDFSKYSFEEANLFLCGFPEHLSFEREDGYHHVWMSYMTLPDDGASHTEDFIYASYEMKKDDNVTSDGLRTLLPKAPGISGSFVLKVTPFDVNSPQLWTPSMAKVIAMQVSWNQKTWIKASNIKHLFGLLNRSNGT